MGSFIHSVLDFVLLLVTAVILLGVTIFVHELFHFITARKCGLVVETFSIGFGPAIWKKKKDGITYKLGVIPFGGYVALPQLDPSGMDRIQGKEEDSDGEQKADESVCPLPDISPWRKIPVAAAGVVGNILLAILLSWVIYLSPGAHTSEGDSVLGFVDESSEAYVAGLRVGDEIVSVNDESVKTWHAFVTECVLSSAESGDIEIGVRRSGELLKIVAPVVKGEMGETHVEGIGPSSSCVISEVQEGGAAEAAGVMTNDLVLVYNGVAVAGVSHFMSLVADGGEKLSEMRVFRNGEEVDIQVTPRFDEELGRTRIGVALSMAEIGALPWMRHKKPWAQIKGDAGEIFRILEALLTPKHSKQAAAALGGPIMILTYLWLSIKVSIFNAIGFLRFLNVNLAILNLLPIPVLDGGHIVFCLWEGITRRKVAPKFVNVLTNVFATLLICVFVLLTFRDFIRLPRIIDGIKGFVGDDVEQVETNDTAVGGVDEP